MKKKNPVFLGIALLISIFIANTPSFAEDIVKIGVVDFRKIAQQTKIGKHAKLEIEKMKNDFQSDLNKKKAEIETLKQKLAGGALVLSEKAFEEKERKLRIMLNDFRTLKGKYRAEFQKYLKKVNRHIIKQVRAAAERYAKIHGYLLILEKYEGGVLYFANATDITDVIAKEIMKIPPLSAACPIHRHCCKKG